MPRHLYSLFLSHHDVAASCVVKHEGKCKCHEHVSLDFVSVIPVPKEAVSVVLAMASSSFLGGTDAQNLISCEALYLALRAVHANGYSRDNAPASPTDSAPFVDKFIAQYTWRLFDIAAPSQKHLRPHTKVILKLAMEEHNRLNLPPPSEDLSGAIASIAKAIKTELEAQGAPNVEKQWVNYATNPRHFPVGTSSTCTGEVVLSSNYFI